MAEFDSPEIEVQEAPEPAYAPFNIRFTEAGVFQVAAIIAAMKNTNDELLAQLTNVQAVSTAQVERIRELEQQLADANQILEQV